GPAAKPSAAQATPRPAQPATPSIAKEAKATPPPAAPRAPSPQRGDGGGEGARTDGHAPDRVFSSPLARRLAKEAGLDIGRSQGGEPRVGTGARVGAAAREVRGLVALPAAAAGARGSMIAPAMTDQQI